MPAIMVTGDPLICYCGKPTKVYDSLFRRNFCSDECSTALCQFLGGVDKAVEIMKEIRAGDFRICGNTVILSETLQKHQVAKATSIDKIDAQVQAQLEHNKLREEMKKKLNLPYEVIDAMLAAKKGA